MRLAQRHQIKLSTRSETKQAELQQAGFDAYIVDIEAASPLSEAFFAADVLIINITCKNLEAYRRLIAQIEASSIRKVLFVSSSSVYQNLDREVSEDEGAENPDSPIYRIEQMLCESRAFETTVLRFSGLVGKGRHPGRFFRGGKTLKQPAAPINLIHFDDCLGIIEAIIAQEAWGQVFNGCSDTHPQKRAFYAKAAAEAGMPLAEMDSHATLSFKIVSNQKVKQQLDYQFIHPDLMQLNQEHYE